VWRIADAVEIVGTPSASPASRQTTFMAGFIHGDGNQIKATARDNTFFLIEAVP
jgi:hypothetical protein